MDEFEDACADLNLPLIVYFRKNPNTMVGLNGEIESSGKNFIIVMIFLKIQYEAFNPL